MTPCSITFCYYLFLMVLVLVFYLSKTDNGTNKGSVFLLLAVLLSYIGLRDIDVYYVDTVTYAHIFNLYKDNPSLMLSLAPDYGFAVLTYILSLFGNETFYFTIIGILYVIPLYIVMRRNIKNNYYTVFLLIVCSFSFLSYGVNGLRNGLATTFLICAFFDKKNVYQLLWILLAVSMHKSALLPGVIFLVAKYYNNPKAYVYLWFFCMALTIVAHDEIGQYLGSVTLFDGGDDSRLAGYLNGKFDGGESGSAHFSATGFRYDFVLYSSVPIYLGWKFIYKYKYTNSLYQALYCTYVGANAFWLLIIYIPFNNRFAYLSWFMYPIVLSYPLLTESSLINNTKKKIKLMVLLNFLFTFYMWLK